MKKQVISQTVKSLPKQNKKKPTETCDFPTILKFHFALFYIINY